VTVLGDDQAISGGGVLPGFEVTLSDLFARADRQGPAESR
jgi:pantothenate kinase type III